MKTCSVEARRGKLNGCLYAKAVDNIEREGQAEPTLA
jgi:hypothetical protein